MPAFAWWFVMSAGLACILVECAARLIQAIGARRQSTDLADRNERLRVIYELTQVPAPAAAPDDKDRALARIATETDQPVVQRHDTNPSIFAFLTTIGTKNVFLAAGIGLLLIPAVLGSGVSIDFNGSAPVPAASPAATP